MRCRVCSEDKLSEEFIPYDMTSSCKHPRLMCLRCATKAASTSGKCPYKDCGQPAPVDSDQVLEFKAMLDCLFAEIYPLSDDLPPPVNEEGTHPIINIVMLTGERHVFRFDPTYTVLHLKKMIFQELKISVEKQKLLYEEQELEDYIDRRESHLNDYDIRSNSSIFLLILLYSLPSRLDHVTFDLSWNYPNSGRDYLDATCLSFRGTQYDDYVDFGNVVYCPDSAITVVGTTYARGLLRNSVEIDESRVYVRHTGDRMNNFLRTGRHTIDVYVKRLPATITHLVFVLSAWEHPTISHFPNPTLKFYEKSKPNVNLCETTFTHAKHSSAVIMCSMTRLGGRWRIIESGALCSGNAKNYEPIKATIRQMIAEGKC